MKVYQYKNCSTCRNALKYLDAKGVSYDCIAIRETPPSKTELKNVLKSVGELKRLFNTSGQDYRAMNMKEKLPKMTQAEALDLLSQNGNLVKRPFVVGKGIALVGFKQEEWDAVFS